MNTLAEFSACDAATVGRADRAALAARVSAGVRILCAVLLLTGAVSRLAPLLDHGGRLFQQFPTEDGYLMLTIARNLAIGNGMSTAAGTIPTNGTQPLCTFLWAACFRVVDGDKAGGVALVLVCEFIIATLAAWVLYRLGRWLLAGRFDASTIALLAAAAWYASPVTLPHTMNCLETGTYALVVLLCCWALAAASREPRAPWPLTWCVGLGLLLGLAFWVRNDAVWLVAAACLVRVGPAVAGRAGWVRRLTETFVMGATSVAASLPWLIFNKTRFGSIMPISGVSESIKSHMGVNLPHLPVPLAEYLLVLLPVPSQWEVHPAAIAIGLLVSAGMVAVAARAWRCGGTVQRTLIAVTGLYAIGLLGFYGIFFGAGYFLNRYLFPLSPLLALIAVAAAWRALHSLRPQIIRVVRPAAAVVVCFLVVGLNVRIYRNGDRHQHFQVVEWVRANVPEETWVAAGQTGTLGFFHDRTINLDGKVNPEALQIRLASPQSEGLPQYVLDKNVQYLADWVGIAGWAHLPGFGNHFEILIEDAERNLGVLRRRSGPGEASATHGG